MRSRRSTRVCVLLPPLCLLGRVHVRVLGRVCMRVLRRVHVRVLARALYLRTFSEPPKFKKHAPLPLYRSGFSRRRGHIQLSQGRLTL